MFEKTATSSVIGTNWAGDQAAGLRRLFGGHMPRVVTFASGQEACGRTRLVVQTATALAAAGYGVLVVDENDAPDNILSAFGLVPRHDLFEVLQGESTLRQATVQASPMLRVVPAARAARELDRANRHAAAARRNLPDCLLAMQTDVDFVLIDTAIRRGGHLSPLALAARHMAVVVAAQSTSITRAYALIKRLAQERGRDGFQVVVTRARNKEEALAIYGNMRRVAREHLDVRLDFLGASLPAANGDLADALLQRLPLALEDGNGRGSGFTWPNAGLTVAATKARGSAVRGHGIGGMASLDSVV